MSRRRDERPPGRDPEAPDHRLVDTVPGLDEATRALTGAGGPLAVDVERASGIRYSDRAFLVQVRAATGPAWLVDPEATDAGLGPLAGLLSERPLLFHAASQDLPSLAELGVRPAALVDTELAGRLLGLERVNLGAMVSEFLGVSLAKAHSAADWSRRPLPEAWLDYAAYDVVYLHRLADELLARLDEAGRREWLEQECEYVARATAPPAVAEPWRRISHVTSLRTPRELARARALWRVRDAVAAERDVASKRLLPDAAIVAAAAADPRTTDALLAIPGFDGPHRSRIAGRFLDALREADALPAAELPDRRGPRGAHPAHTSWRRVEPEAAELLAAARDGLAARAEELGVDPAVLLRPATLRLWVWRVVRERPADPAALLDEVHAAEGTRPWQRGIVDPVLLEAHRAFRAD